MKTLSVFSTGETYFHVQCLQGEFLLDVDDQANVERPSYKTHGLDLSRCII